MMERKIAPIFRAALYFIVWRNTFLCGKGKENELIFHNKEDFDFLLRDAGKRDSSLSRNQKPMEHGTST